MVRLARMRSVRKFFTFGEFRHVMSGLSRMAAGSQKGHGGNAIARARQNTSRGSGSVSPGAGSSASSPGSVSRAVPWPIRPIQAKRRRRPSSSARTSGPRWKASRTSWPPPLISSVISMDRAARSSRTERRCVRGRAAAWRSRRAQPLQVATVPSSVTAISASARAAATGTGRLGSTATARRSPPCCARSSTGSTFRHSGSPW